MAASPLPSTSVLPIKRKQFPQPTSTPQSTSQSTPQFNPLDIGYFDPYKHSLALFLEQANSYASKHGKTFTRRNLHKCLQDDAKDWYDELDDNDKKQLTYGNDLDNWTETLIEQCGQTPATQPFSSFIGYPPEAMYELIKQPPAGLTLSEEDEFILGFQNAKRMADAQAAKEQWKQDIRNEIWGIKKQANQQTEQAKQSVCRRCSETFPSASKLHEHLRAKHAKQAVPTNQTPAKQALQNSPSSSNSSMQTSTAQTTQQSPQQAQRPPSPAPSDSSASTSSTVPTTSTTASTPPPSYTSSPPSATSAAKQLSYAQVTKQAPPTPPPSPPVTPAASPKPISKRPPPTQSPPPKKQDSTTTPPRTWMTMQELINRFRGKPRPAFTSPRPPPAAHGAHTKPTTGPKNKLSPTATPFHMRPSPPQKQTPRFRRLVPPSPRQNSVATTKQTSTPAVHPPQTSIPAPLQMDAWSMQMFCAWQTWMRQGYGWMC